MSDSIINAEQKLLKRQFPSLNGLQDVTLGNVMSYRIQTKEFLQILHSSNHWLMISTVGVQHPSFQVYDISLYDSIPVMVKAQIASLLCTSSKKIDITIMDVQRQVSFCIIVLAIININD